MCLHTKCLKILLLTLCFVSPTLVLAEEFCAENNSNLKMSLGEALKIAKSTPCCTKVGKIKNIHWCNENSGTFWFMLKSKMKGCSPACVVSVRDKTATVNYMCTGLLEAKKHH